MNLQVYYKGLGTGFILGYLSYFLYKKLFKPVTNNDYFKFVMVLRTDINLEKRKVAEYCSQAALECYRKALQLTPEYVNKWEKNSQPKIALKLDDNTNENILKLRSKADDLGIVSVAIKEKDKNNKDIYAVLGVGPAPQDLIDKVTGHLKLF